MGRGDGMRSLRDRTGGAGGDGARQGAGALGCCGGVRRSEASLPYPSGKRGPGPRVTATPNSPRAYSSPQLSASGVTSTSPSNGARPPKGVFDGPPLIDGRAPIPVPLTLLVRLPGGPDLLRKVVCLDGISPGTDPCALQGSKESNVTDWLLTGMQLVFDSVGGR